MLFRAMLSAMQAEMVTMPFHCVSRVRMWTESGWRRATGASTMKLNAMWPAAGEVDGWFSGWQAGVASAAAWKRYRQQPGQQHKAAAHSHDVRRKGKRKPPTESAHLFRRLSEELRLREQKQMKKNEVREARGGGGRSGGGRQVGRLHSRQVEGNEGCQ